MNNNKTKQIAELANQNARQVFQTAYRLIGDKHLAEDIVQDVFIKLFNKELTEFSQIKSWPAYLKVMTTSASYDLLRKKCRQAEHSLDESPASLIESMEQDAPDKQLMRNQEMNCFRNALCQISQLEAKVFSLRHIDEFSYQEIAQQLNITTGNVGITLNRAKQKLSQLLKESHVLGVSYESK